ncbi:MAG: hypothetical protein DI598_03655 [Pseudopedobacter saltans]|uniref:Arm DNA-binding domain-containing protein n=1 Tax=Pseudopedobacter saltans TaxID=151895 RepID=A0A2W5F5G7_9SPHI|nr:MAG: hypothetical protein DI598_03655 [Pseudopedobacter saltans]
MKQFQQTIGICFFVRKNKEKNDRWPVYARITVNNLRCDFSIKESVSIKGWDDKHGRAKNTLPEYRMLNTYLEEVPTKLCPIITSNKTITADILKRKYFGLYNQTRNLMELIEYHNIQMVGKLAEETLKNYRSTARLVKF